MATRRRFRRQSRHLKKRRSYKYKKYKKSRRNYYNMRGGAPIDIEIPKFIKAMKIKKLDNFDLPLKSLGLDNDVLYIDGGIVLNMQLSILPDGSGILRIGTLNGAYAGSFTRDTPTNTDYNITKAKKDEILKMVGDVYEA